jgi:hypothetical protein
VVFLFACLPACLLALPPFPASFHYFLVLFLLILFYFLFVLRAAAQVLLSTDVDEQGSKVPAFFSQADRLLEEMKWQKKLKSHINLYATSNEKKI